MSNNKKIVLLIPAYQPDETLVRVVRDVFDLVRNQPFQFKCVIIDDGSDTALAKQVFEELSHLSLVTILSHSSNRGKGAALKTGFKNILNDSDQVAVIVTADADGQHLPKDIVRIASHALKNNVNSIGVREFDKNVPFRSRFGNIATRKLFKLLHGDDIVDTQTGLRAIINQDLEGLLLIEHEGYDYELEMLVKMVKKKPIQQTPISTVYEPGNPSSHFNPVFDSLKIYAVLLRHSAVTLFVACIDFLIFLILTKLDQTIVLSLIVSRAVSTAILFSLAREFVFKSNRNVFKQLIKYFTLVAFNIVFLWMFIRFMVDNFALERITAMVFGYIIFFVGNFWIQRYFIFDQRKTNA